MTVPLLTIVVPAFNADGYLERALEPLVGVDGNLEVVVVDDGSSDGTGPLADRYAQRHPERFRVAHQSNSGHGGALNTGIALARGTYLKVLDADDWLDATVLRQTLDLLAELERRGGVDALFADFVYQRLDKSPRPSRFSNVFPAGGPFGWDRVERFRPGQYPLMHAIIYRTQVVRDSGLRLPEHTFYVDNLFVVVPLSRVRRMAYLPLPLYHYVIGRVGQSVGAEVMLARVDQQLRVNRLALAALPFTGDVEDGSVPAALHSTLMHYVEGLCTVTLATLTRGGTPEHMSKRADFWHHVRDESPRMHGRLRRSLTATGSRLPGSVGRHVTNVAYHIARRAVGFT